MRRRRHSIGAIAAGGTLVLLLAAPAVAKPSFPGDVKADLQSPSLGYPYPFDPPPCRVCHIQGTTGAGTIQTPFGISMLANGMSGDKGSLMTALTALSKLDIDSDGDGVPDVQELAIKNTDPNTPAGGQLAGDPDYGCVVGGAGHAGPLPVMLTAIALLRPARRRRR